MKSEPRCLIRIMTGMIVYMMLIHPLPIEITSQCAADDTCLFKLNELHWFTLSAPVVPVVRTISSQDVYLALFKPSESGFWEGNLVHYGLNDNLEMVDKTGAIATYSNGAIKETATPYWETQNWAKPTATNYVLNSDRNIYSYRGSDTNLTHSVNAFNSVNFGTLVGDITVESVTYTPDQVIGYIRGADVRDEDNDGNVEENRRAIAGDILHSEPLVIRYSHYKNPYGSDRSVIYFGANDGMLHAVNARDGKELWAFIPPDQLHRLNLILGHEGHPHYVDGSPKAFLSDQNGNRCVDKGETAYVVCGERSGGSGVFALDVSDPDVPLFLWRISQTDDTATAGSAPTTLISELGESWSDPAFGKVDNGGTLTDACFLGGGYSSDHSKGAVAVVLNIHNGFLIRKFTGSDNGRMSYCFPTALFPMDTDGDGIINKMYAGDAGGQLWRFASFEQNGSHLTFPKTNQNLQAWRADVIFQSPNHAPVFYPPSAALEKGYDILFIGTGNRDIVCSATPTDYIVAVKDTHRNDPPYPLSMDSLSNGKAAMADVSKPLALPLNFDDPDTYGWYLPLGPREKVVSSGVVFHHVFYITTFQPNMTGGGGTAKLYALGYKTGTATVNLDNNTGTGSSSAGIDRDLPIGSSLPSRPITVMTDTAVRMLTSVGKTAQGSSSTAVGIVTQTVPVFNNFYKIWWREF